MSEENKIRDAVDAVTGLAKAVPIYDDLVQPTAQEVGRVTARTVRAALSPLRAVVWGVEQVEAFLGDSVAARLKDLPPERIVTPPLRVAGPAAQALLFAGPEPVLRDMFAALLATSMNADTTSRAHPAFVEMIRQLEPDEAKVLAAATAAKSVPLVDVRAFEPGEQGFYVAVRRFGVLSFEAGCAYPERLPEYLDNLERLGLIEMPPGEELTAVGVYDPLEQHEFIRSWRQGLEAKGHRVVLQRGHVEPTDLGVQFAKACGLMA